MSINKTIYYIPIRERKKERKKENESEKPRKPGTFLFRQCRKERERKKEKKVTLIDVTLNHSYSCTKNHR